MNEKPGIEITHPVAIGVILTVILAIYAIAGTAAFLFIKHFW